MQKTDRRKLATFALAAKGVDLDEYVAGLRSDGLGWRAVATRLLEEHAVEISFLTLYRWYTPESQATSRSA